MLKVPLYDFTVFNCDSIVVVQAYADTTLIQQTKNDQITPEFTKKTWQGFHYPDIVVILQHQGVNVLQHSKHLLSTAELIFTKAYFLVRTLFLIWEIFNQNLSSPYS